MLLSSLIYTSQLTDIDLSPSHIRVASRNQVRQYEHGEKARRFARVLGSTVMKLMLRLGWPFMTKEGESITRVPNQPVNEDLAYRPVGAAH
jgi:hypothetical protein